jgi:hypothetical protein
MRAYWVEQTLSEDGVLELRALPFRAGEIVEVIILSRKDKVDEGQNFPLKGKVLSYEKPTEPVAQDDWEVAKLVQYRRLELACPLEEWMQQGLAYSGL